MEIDTTGGAIEQHLKKLHTRREEGEKKVPPAPSRGSRGETVEASHKATARCNKKQRRSTDVRESEEEWVESKVPARRTRRLPQPRYVENPDFEYEDESDSSGSEIVATGASFLQLPNDKRPGSPRSPSSQAPSTPMKIVSYKCPKNFLAGLSDKKPDSRAFSTSPHQKAILKEEPRMEIEPAVKSEQMTPDCVLYGAFPSLPVSNPTPTTIPRSFQPILSNNVKTNHGLTTDISVHNTQPENRGTLYIPTGNTALDLPPIGDMITDPFAFNECLPPLQGFEMDQSFLADQGYQDMLGEYFIPPDETDWYSGQFRQ
ncbi:uncharacterized protein BDV14DRAFT_185401 [Aspergillus stella-maris]|uniref:uncharacterized protein n=1 Tax=Aspergillus stella-maris TaxID=1810926 RepID=UPI003CCCBC85